MTAFPRVSPFGEAALLVELGEVVDPELNARVHALADRLDEGAFELEGLGRCVPAYASLLVPFDPLQAEPAALAERLTRLAAATEAPAASGARVEIPVMYGYDDGPDLEAVASSTGLSPDAVIDQHAAAEYRVYMLGFAPGFAYLGPLPAALRLPRRAEPRVRVPAGSVAIAGAQSAVYPQETAGGWHLIGRTEVRLWDPSATRPARLRPGDRVRFVPA
jgi:KipI family sensor histidine kinase inhibitor